MFGTRTIILIPTGAILAMMWMIGWRWTRYRYKKRHSIGYYAEQDVELAYICFRENQYGKFVECMNQACEDGPDLAWTFLRNKVVQEKNEVLEMAKVYMKTNGPYVEAAKKILSGSSIDER